MSASFSVFADRAQDVKRIEGLQKSFKRGSFEQRSRALQDLRRFDLAEAAAALVMAYQQLEKEARPIERDRRKLIVDEGGSGRVPAAEARVPDSPARGPRRSPDATSAGHPGHHAAPCGARLQACVLLLCHAV